MAFVLSSPSCFNGQTAEISQSVQTFYSETLLAMTFVLPSPSCFNEKCTFKKLTCVIVVASRDIQDYGDY